MFLPRTFQSASTPCESEQRQPSAQMTRKTSDTAKPRRTYIGPRYNGGLSDHLPVYLKVK